MILPIDTLSHGSRNEDVAEMPMADVSLRAAENNFVVDACQLPVNPPIAIMPAQHQTPSELAIEGSSWNAHLPQVPDSFPRLAIWPNAMLVHGH